MWLKLNLHRHAYFFLFVYSVDAMGKIIFDSSTYELWPLAKIRLQSISNINNLNLPYYRPGMNLMPSWAHLQGRSLVWNPLVSCLDFKFNIKNKCKNQNQIQDSCSSLCVFRRRENNYKESFLHLMNLFASHVMKNPHVWLFLRRFARGGESYKNVPI